MIAKKIKIIAIVMLSVVTTSFARSAKNIFIADNLKLFPLISESTRLDIADYFDSGSLKRDFVNMAGDTFYVDTIAPDLVKVRYSKARTITVWVVDTANSKSPVVVIDTYYLPVADGRIRVYNADLTLDAGKKVFPSVQMQDFIVIPKGSSETDASIMSKIDFPLVSYEIDADNKVVNAVQTVDEYMGKVDYPSIEKYMKKKISYRWDGKKFRKQ